MADDLKPFVCSFPYDGSRWGIEIYARDFDDAKRRLERIGTNGTVDGEFVAKVPVMSGGFLVPLYCWIRNLFTPKPIG